MKAASVVQTNTRDTEIPTIDKIWFNTLSHTDFATCTDTLNINNIGIELHGVRYDLQT